MKNGAPHVVNNAQLLLIALPPYGNMPGNQHAASSSRPRQGNEEEPALKRWKTDRDYGPHSRAA
jgi:hypothetical protein